MTSPPSNPVEHVPDVLEGRLLRSGASTYHVESTAEGAANAGIVVGSEATLLVDMRLTPELGADLVSAARRLETDSTVRRYFINTHYHGDHSFGNEAARDAVGIAAQVTRESIASEWERQVATFVDLRPHQAAAFAAARKVVPALGFSGAMRLDLGGVSVTARQVGRAHTAGDTIVIVDADRVVFTGDVIYHGHWPVLKYGSVRGWLAALEVLLALRATIYVPGHGPAGGAEVVRLMQRCLKFVVAQASEGASGEAATAAAQGSEEFGSWLHPERIPGLLSRVRELAADDPGIYELGG